MAQCSASQRQLRGARLGHGLDDGHGVVPRAADQVRHALQPVQQRAVLADLIPLHRRQQDGLRRRGAHAWARGRRGKRRAGDLGHAPPSATAPPHACSAAEACPAAAQPSTRAVPRSGGPTSAQAPAFDVAQRTCTCTRPASAHLCHLRGARHVRQNAQVAEHRGRVVLAVHGAHHATALADGLDVIQNGIHLVVDTCNGRLSWMWRQLRRVAGRAGCLGRCRHGVGGLRGRGGAAAPWWSARGRSCCARPRRSPCSLR